MGDCVYCGQPAGLFRSKHRECQERRDEGLGRLTALARRSLIPDADVPAIGREMDALMLSHRVDRAAKTRALVTEWSAAVDRFAEDGIVTPEEEAILARVGAAFGLEYKDLNFAGAGNRLLQALLLRDLKDGIVDKRCDSSWFNRVNFQRGERVAWIFANVDLVQEKTRRSYVGRSAGVSMRVVKGVYLRTGAFQGHAVEHNEMVTVDRGWAVFTDRNLYFSGASKAWRLPWGKIVSMTPYRDGLGVIKDGANARPQVLMIPEGGFAFNLAQALSWISEDM